MKKYLEIGKIVAVQGLKGEVRVQCWCDSPEFLCDFETLYFEAGRTPVKIERARVQKTLAIVKLEGTDTVEQAELLRNKILYMDRDDVELEDGCYFVQDLIGLKCLDADSGKEYGILSEVTETGANDVYHIKDGEGKEWLVPAIPDVIIDTDITNGIITIRPLKGLFDDED